MVKVSIVVPTYNHAPFIAQCLDSLLAQETDFVYEILIGEDDSTDGTREICMEYARKYPDKIRLFLNKRENVVYINGYPTGRWNILNLLRHAQGEYIAFCDGDDFWNDSSKLQKQIRFLDQHPDYGLVHTRVSLLFESKKKHIPDLHKYMRLSTPEGNVYEQLLQRSFIVTVSMVVRQNLIMSLLQWEAFDPYRYMMLDYPIKLYAAYHSKVGMIPEVLATHRILKESMSNSKNIHRMLQFYQSQYEIIQLFCSHFGCSSQTKIAIDKRFFRMFMKRLAVLGNTREARFYFIKLKTLVGGITHLSWNDLAYGVFTVPGINFLFRKLYSPILKYKASSF